MGKREFCTLFIRWLIIAFKVKAIRQRVIFSVFNQCWCINYVGLFAQHYGQNINCKKSSDPRTKQEKIGQIF